MYCADQEVDDVAVAQSTPLPECIAGFEGDTVRRLSHSLPSLSIVLCFLCPLRSYLLCEPTPSLVQGGEAYAKGFGITILIPKNFRHESFEAEETAKELAAKEKAAEATVEAEDEAKKVEPKAKKSTAVKQADTKHEIKKQAATDKQKTAAAPAKEDAPVKCCTVSFPGAHVVLVIAALFFAVTMALRSNSSMPTGAAKVVTTKSFSSWANDQQCGLYDNNDFCGVQEKAVETTCPADVAKGFARSLSLDATAAVRAGLCVEKEEGVACPPWWLPLLMGTTPPPPSSTPSPSSLPSPPAAPRISSASPPPPSPSPPPFLLPTESALLHLDYRLAVVLVALLALIVLGCASWSPSAETEVRLRGIVHLVNLLGKFSLRRSPNRIVAVTKELDSLLEEVLAAEHTAYGDGPKTEESKRVLHNAWVQGIYAEGHRFTVIGQFIASSELKNSLVQRLKLAQWVSASAMRGEPLHEVKLEKMVLICGILKRVETAAALAATHSHPGATAKGQGAPPHLGQRPYI